MKVKAIKQGHYGILRNVGEVFVIRDEKAFSKRWMKRVKDELGVSRPELDEDGRPIEPPRRYEPAKNIKDVTIDGQGEVYEDDGSDDYVEEGDGVEENVVVEEPKTRRRGRGGPKPTVHE